MLHKVQVMEAMLQVIYFLQWKGAISNFFPRKDPNDRSREDEASASCAHYAAACWGSEGLSAKEQCICYIYELET